MSQGPRGMRCAAVVVVLTLLLPTTLETGGRSDGPAPAPLNLFGGGPTPRAASASVLVVDVYYNALRPDEYVALANVAGTPVDLGGWKLTDNEGTLTFPGGSAIPANGRIVVAQNSTAYYEDTLQVADLRYLAGNATIMGASGSFQLANAGDEVILKDATGTTIDALVYGSSTYAGAGWTGPAAKAVGSGYVARRAFDGAWRDTNTSADWDLVRVWSLGQSDVGSAAFAFTGSAMAFVSPDAGLGPITDLIANATQTIDLEVYTFTSSALAAPLTSAMGRGVRVRLLLEGGPVGGIDADEWDLARDLAAAGADVHFMVNNTTRDIQARFRYVHAKFAVVDHETVLVSSQNWGPSSFPSGATRGSRGWSLAVTHAPLAAYFERVFAADFDVRRRDVLPLAEMTVPPVAHEPTSTHPRVATFPPRRFTGAFAVTPVLAPDTSLESGTILGAIRNATRSIHAEMFYAYPRWDGFPDLYLEELLAAARRGVAVRLLLDASKSNVAAGAMNNTNTIAYVSGVAAKEGLDLQAKLADLGVHGLTEVHNKGLVIDGRTVLVSSINWNRNSATANREAGLLVVNPDVGAYFERAFAWDWNDDLMPPRADAGPDRTVDIGEVVAFSGLGSSDNVAVTNWSWDLDGDGGFDHWGAQVAHVYRQPGTYAVRLRVADAWNNTANATATVTVRARSVVADSTLLWILPLLAAAGFFAIFVVRRRRKGIK